MGEDVDMDDKASVANSIAGASTVRGGDGTSVAATPGTTVVGSIATESVAASDLGMDQMMVDESAAVPKEATPKVSDADIFKVGETVFARNRSELKDIGITPNMRGLVTA